MVTIKKVFFSKINIESYLFEICDNKVTAQLNNIILDYPIIK